MARQILAPIFVAALVVLAGCSGGGTLDGATATDGIDSTTAPSADAETAATPDGSPASADGDSAGNSGGDDSDGGSGSVRFYVSDERNAIGDFRHLNVTISKIGLKPADAAEDEPAATETPTATPTATATSTATATPSPTPTATPTSDDTNSSASLAALATEDATATSTAAMVASGGSEKGGWIEYDVDSRTYDLTELQGASASHLADVTVPRGEYETVFVYVSSVEGTLDDGTSVNVKLPSEKLHLNKGFAVGGGESVDFVYDVTVHRAGRSGKYILKPVVGQSGTSDEVDIEVVDDDSDDADDADEGTALSASFVGEVSPGNDTVVEVALNGTALADATVEVDDAVAGETNESGRLTVSVPENADEFEVRVTYGDEEIELSRQFGSEGSGGDSDGAAKGKDEEKDRGGGNGEGGGNDGKN